MKINNFVIDRVLRGMMFSTSDGSYMWSINQITDPSLNITSETAEAVDALGSRIAVFNRGKSAEFSAQNSLFDLGLFAAQNGVEVKDASVDSVVAPIFDEITVVSGTTVYALAKTPVDGGSEFTAIYGVNGDGTLGEKFTKSSTSSVSDTTFAYNATDHEITIPTNLTYKKLMAIYDYTETAATYVTGDAVNFPKAGRFVMEVLGADVCDPTTLIHAYLVFPNAKLDANVDLSFTTDGNHPFTIQCQQSYCDNEKILYQLIIPEVSTN